MLNPLFREVPVEQQELASGGTCLSTSSLFNSLTSLLNVSSSSLSTSLSKLKLGSLVTSIGLPSQVTTWLSTSGLTSLL